MGLFGFGKKENNTASSESKMQRAQELYEKGCALFNQKNYKEAMPLILEAAELGLSDAQNHLGVDYRLGEGVPKDPQQGIAWYRKAAAQGNAKAQMNLGQIYKRGVDLPRDIQEAARLFRLSAEQGYPKAQTHMGVLYEAGEGVEQNYSMAAMWYQKAAEQGYAIAQYNLGRLYNEGLGLPQSIVEARLWWEAAAAQGYERSKKALQELDDLFSTAVDHFEKQASDAQAAKASMPAPQPEPAPPKAEPKVQAENAAPADPALSWYNPDHNQALLKSVLNVFSGDSQPAAPAAKTIEKTAEAKPAEKPPVPPTPQPAKTDQPRMPLSETELTLQNAVAAYNAGNLRQAMNYFARAAELGHTYAAQLAVEIGLLPEIHDYPMAEKMAVVIRKSDCQKADQLLKTIYADAGCYYMAEFEQAKKDYLRKNFDAKNFEQTWEEAPKCPEAKSAITQALFYLRKAAEAGSVWSMVTLSNYLLWQHAQNKNLDELGEAERWITRAELMEDSAAKQLAGWICRIYYGEMGLKFCNTDQAKAAEYFRKGAQRGSSSCMLNAAIALYNIGLESPKTTGRKSLEEALKWAIAASEKGEERATGLIQKIRAFL